MSIKRPPEKPVLGTTFISVVPPVSTGDSPAGYKVAPTEQGHSYESLVDKVLQSECSAECKQRAASFVLHYLHLQKEAGSECQLEIDVDESKDLIMFGLCHEGRSASVTVSSEDVTSSQFSTGVPTTSTSTFGFNSLNWIFNKD